MAGASQGLQCSDGTARSTGDGSAKLRLGVGGGLARSMKGSSPGELRHQPLFGLLFQSLMGLESREDNTGVLR